MYGCGQNRNYELGMEDKGQIINPAVIGILPHKINKIRSGKKFILILDSYGNIYGMGHN